VALDSTRADTLFYTKITFATSREPVDTARFLKWARMGTNKYPKNGYLLGQLVSAYGYAGPVDSLVSTTKRLVQVDSSDVTPVLKAVQALAAAKRAREALELGAYVERLGDAEAKSNLGIILAQTVGLPLLQVQPPDPPLIADVGRKATQLTKPGSRENQLANYVLGLGLLLQIQNYDQQAVAAKTCDGVKALETFVNEAKTALTTGQAINKDFVGQRLTQIDQYYLNENPKVGRIAQMKKAFCK